MPDKKRERYYFDLLRRAVSEIPPGEPVECEQPDFLLRADPHRLGIELTTFHLPPPPGERPYQEQQSLKERIVSVAERLHTQAGGPALYVGVYFSQRDVLRKSDIQPLAKSIAESVLRAPYPTSMNEPVELRFGAVPDGVWGIQIHPSGDGTDKLWHEDAGGWVADITPTHVSEVISAKSRMAAEAKRKCVELWLVIVHDEFSKSAPAAITAEALAAEYHGPFDRVIWFAPHARTPAVDLKCLAAA